MTTITRLSATRWRIAMLGIAIGLAPTAGLAATTATPATAATPTAIKAAPAASKTVLLAWGQNAWGQLGNGNTTDSDRSAGSYTLDNLSVSATQINSGN